MVKRVVKKGREEAGRSFTRNERGQGQRGMRNEGRQRKARKKESR